MFIYCFDKKDKEDLISKGYKFLREENTNGKISYIFIDNNKLNFDLDNKRFVKTNKMNF